MPINCHFRDSKALLVTSLIHVSGDIASVQTFTFYLPPLWKMHNIYRRLVRARSGPFVSQLFCPSFCAGVLQK